LETYLSTITLCGTIKRNSPEEPNVPVVDFLSEEYRLGGAGNVAANLWSLSKKGDNEIYLSSIISDFSAKLLKEAGVFYDDIVLKPKHEGAPHDRELIKHRIIKSDDLSQLIRLDNRQTFSDLDILRFKNKCYFDKFIGFDAVVVSDYNKGIIDADMIARLSVCKLPVFIDTKKPDLSLWQKIEKCYVKINSKEFAASKNFETLTHLIVTEGQNGCSYYSKGLLTAKYNTVPVEDPDVTGAGDVFFSAFILSLLERFPIEEAMKRANKAASISCTRFGTTTVTRSEL
jgi:bifunctional ADP-heptose synthase (sugar kinase/adenylyltransferase)